MSHEITPAYKVARILSSHLDQSLADSQALVSNLDEVANMVKTPEVQLIKDYAK